MGLEKIGSVERIELPAEGETFSAREAMATIEGTLGRLIVPAPCDCTILEANPAIVDDKDLVEEDPLDGGWVVRVDADETDLEPDEEDEDSDEEEDEDLDDDGDEEI